MVVADGPAQLEKQGIDPGTSVPGSLDSTAAAAAARQAAKRTHAERNQEFFYLTGPIYCVVMHSHSVVTAMHSARGQTGARASLQGSQTATATHESV